MAGSIGKAVLYVKAIFENAAVSGTDYIKFEKKIICLSKTGIIN
jgi:hypothetical protein